MNILTRCLREFHPLPVCHLDYVTPASLKMGMSLLSWEKGFCGL